MKGCGVTDSPRRNNLRVDGPDLTMPRSNVGRQSSQNPTQYRWLTIAGEAFHGPQPEQHRGDVRVNSRRVTR